MFTGIGHAPQIECPDEFADRVLAFVADADAERLTQPIA
jgi:pimeloyl-ACP methyl ester carboxylesterase